MKATSVTRKTITLPDDLWEGIVDCQHALRLISQAEAIRMIVRAGLDVLKEKAT